MLTTETAYDYNAGNYIVSYIKFRKINMKKSKILTDLHRLLETQDFKSPEELNAFLKKYQGEEIPSFPEEILSNKEKAEDLIYQAYDLNPTEGKKLAKQSLKLDPNCLMAYQYLGQHQNDIKKAIGHYKKGVTIGSKLFGGEFEEENEGHFWLIHETRPYMSCMFHLAECYFYNRQAHKAIELAEQILRLNPNDNQGIRYNLSTYLLAEKQFDKLNQLFLSFEDDGGIVFLYNKALSEYIQKNPSILADKLLKEAIKRNPAVISNLNKNIRSNAASYIRGGEEEAIYYLEHNKFLWQVNEGAMKWAKSWYKKISDSAEN